MGARGFLCYLFVAAHTGISWESLSSCDEVRKVYEMKLIGPVKSIPVKPRTGSDLQVCMSRNLTCCTKKMEERYQAAARQDLQNLLQTSSSSLKFLISRNVAAFQETVEALVRQAENHTHAVLLASYGRLAGEAAGGVAELLTDAGLFLLGSELSMDEASRRFFDALFPHVYDRLLRPGLGPISPAYAECLRSARRDLSPFGPAPARLAGRLSRAFLPARVFLQALHLGVEVLNTTDHLPPSRECRRALLRMSYCPHCQGLTASRPCTGYCLNVVRGCLASVAEVDVHWREYVRGLEALSGRMQREVELEQALLQALPEAVGQAVEHAQRNGPRLSAQVHRACGHPSREQVQSGIGQRGGARDSIPLKGPNRGTEETLSNRRKEFINSLRLHRTFYGGLADQLCVSELASGDGQACWNGADVVKSYTMRVVGSGIRAQSANPEVRVKEADPVINQVIDKLKHINQLLQGRSIPKLGTLDQIETGSGDGEDPYSGDCDDEDGCSGSGDAGVRRTVMRTVSKLTPDQNNRHRYHHPQTDDQGTEGPSASGRASQSASWTLLLMCISTLLSA